MSTQKTAKKGVKILEKRGFQELHGVEKSNLVIAFAKKNMVVYGKAFDIVKCSKKIDFMDIEDISKKIDAITVYEIKSTIRKDVTKDFSKYFFDLTTAELLVAQSLKKQFKFAFVNTTTNSFLVLSLTQLFSKAKGIYPKWAIRF